MRPYKLGRKDSTMEEKVFTVTLEIEAKDEEAVERMLESLGRRYGDKILDVNVEDPDKPKLECRIRYDKNWNGEGEHYVFENKWTNEEGWGLDSAFPLVSYEDGKLVRGKGDLLNYQALTKIRELRKLGIYYYFA